MNDIKKNIEELLFNSNVTMYEVSKETGIAQTTLSRFVRRESDIENMSLRNAIKLNNFYKEMDKMEKYIINYGTMVEEVEGTLQEVKEVAVEGMGLTEQAVIIEDEHGNEVTRSEWFGVDGNDEDNVLVQFGNSGYYQVWNDELE